MDCLKVHAGGAGKCAYSRAISKRKLLLIINDATTIPKMKMSLLICVDFLRPLKPNRIRVFSVLYLFSAGGEV